MRVGKTLAGWDKRTVWNRFDGTNPRLIPSDAGIGLEKDLTLYENAMVIPASSIAQQTPAKMAFLQIPDLIALGETWKFVELPHTIDPEKPIVASVSGIRSLLFDKANNVEPHDEIVDAALKALADYDIKNASLVQEERQRKNRAVPRGTSAPIARVVKLRTRTTSSITTNKLSIAWWPPCARYLFDGVEAARRDRCRRGQARLVHGIQPDRCRIRHENDEPGANVLGNQKKWMANLEKFLVDFPDSDEVPTVLYHLANANEYNAEEETARKQYGKLVESYAAVPSLARRPPVRCCNSSTSRASPWPSRAWAYETTRSIQPMSGKAVLVVFWASWASPVKQELPELIKIYEKYHGRGLEIVGVNLDNSTRA